MNYVYDIFINPNKDYYEFFEWDKKDIIIHLKKVPVLKIHTYFLKHIIINNVKLDDNFVKKYSQKAEIFNSNLKYNYLLFTDSKNVCVIKFDENGNIIKKSSLVYEDETNAINSVKKSNKINLNFSITKIDNEKFLTRQEKNKKSFIIDNIKRISNNKLKYLYFDCFGEINENSQNMLKTITREIKNNNLEIWDKSYNLLSLVYQKNK